MSWYSSVLKEIDGYNDHWRSKLVEAWTEGDVYNWIVSSARLTLVPLNDLPFDQFRHVIGKQLVKWKVSNFVQKDTKNGVFLYLYLQDIISHHKGKPCRNDLVPATVAITTEVDPAIKEELDTECVRVPNISILHTNTWRKKNLSDWTGLDVYHWLVHLCKEHHIPLDKFPFTEFEDFDGMRLLLLSGNDYQKKSEEYGLFIYQSVNQLILHNSDSNINSGHNEDEFATIFTSSAATNNDTHTPHHYEHTPSNYYQQHPPYDDIQTNSTNISLPHSLSPSPSFTTLDGKTATSVKSEARYPTTPPPPPGYPANPLEYLQQRQSSQHEISLQISEYNYPSQMYFGDPHASQHERTSTFTNMDAPSHDRMSSGHHPWKQAGYYSAGDSGEPAIKLEHISPGTGGTSSHDYSTSPSDQYSIYPSSQRRNPPPHHVPYYSDIGGHYPSYTSLHSGDNYYDTSDKTSALEEKQSPMTSRSGKPLPPPPGLIPKSMYKKPPNNTNDLNKSASSCHEQSSSKDQESQPDTGTTAKSPAKKKSTPSSTPEKKPKNKVAQEISKPKGIPYSVLTAYRDPTKLIIKIGNASWRSKQVKLWTDEDVKSWFRTISPDLGLPAHKFPFHLFPEGLTGAKLVEMKKSDFVSKYQKLGENIYEKLEEVVVGESSYAFGSEASNAGTDTSAESRASDNTPDQSSCLSSDEENVSDHPPDPIGPSPTPGTASQASTSSAPDQQPTRRRPGRPKGVTNRNSRRKEKLGKVWQFLINLLHNSEYNPSLICWEKYDEGKFRFVQSDKVASLWGDTKHNETYNYEKFSRAMRFSDFVSDITTSTTSCGQ
uniref:ETS homologous factor n=1 Tax=Cacopsylla melanoneura TaxID=428564 RepID=A0A8D8ZIH0_9HEMI